MAARGALLTIALLAGTASAALAQDAGALTDQQRLGQRLVTQHCGVCHFRLQINVAAPFGPLLSSANFENGREAELRGVIADGQPDMPGFKYLLDPPQIDAVVAYLKTVDARGLTGKPPSQKRDVGAKDPRSDSDD